MPARIDSRGSFVLLAWGLAVWLHGVTFAAEPPDAPLLQQTLPQYFRLKVASGRFEVTAIRRSNTRRTRNLGDRIEQCEVQSALGNAFLRYGLRNPKERFFVHVAAPSSVTIRHMPDGDAPIVPLQLTQSEDQPLRLTVGPQEDRHVYETPTLWHLLLLHPDVAQERLLPLLKVVRPDVDWPGQLGQIEAALLRVAEVGRPHEYARWMDLVDQLGDDRFFQRERADRRLREGGPAVLSFLLQLDRSQLDAEQNFRIERILRSMASSSTDESPDQVASWLAHDPRIWFALLRLEEPGSRRLAAAQLAQMLGEPIGFDPLADAQTRAEQLDRLRRRVFPD